jgi:V8-like Glu-specific endopeptidase
MKAPNWRLQKVYDYALLKLKIDVNESGFIQLCEDVPQLDENTTLSIFGYPKSKYDQKNRKPLGVKQYGLTKTGFILNVDPKLGYMVHRISTEEGQSGAPVIKTDSTGKIMIVGIHIGSEEDKT